MGIGIILASHGDFASGIKNTGDMIMGRQDKVAVCLLMPDDNPEQLKDSLEAAIASFEKEDELLFLVDLWGGTPFNQANQLIQQSDRNIEIASGLNVPMLLQAYSERFNPDRGVTEIVASILSEGKEGIRSNTEQPQHVNKVEPSQVTEMVTNKKMAQLGIQHVRLDERLIHGQVATLWLGKLGATRVMIVDDNVVNDSITKASLKTAVPGGIKLSILKTETASKRLKQGIYQNQKVMIIAKEIETIFALIDSGVPIERFNLGNASSKEGTIQIKRSLFLTEAAIAKLNDLEKQGVFVTAQMVPMEEEKSFSQIYGR
ncbi:PTS system, mannose-specific IIB component [Amphibacillus marinus]|uniref:PTS system mannose-specific EIIAB component n=1 Tax=Amphibacillus marinus TaxID=872970 RepID=A0A1H8LAY9_9BACI|nr:PTS sugar transporter subunit IIB [Amphibacillus marinus]SEO02253.1 PTS system, mannose-specific IIB component [Amphibacillus marinus]